MTDITELLDALEDMARQVAWLVTEVEEWAANRPHSDLPPLPQPEFDNLLDHIYEYGTLAEGTIPRASALCEAYARAAILAERDRFRAMFDEALADHGITWPGEVDILYEKMFPAAAIREGVK